jgi:DNA polymerase-4
VIFLKSDVKVIFHIDLNQFFCSVAILKNPRLKGKAFAIGRENTTKGVISTASYEARKYGIGAGMPLIDAFRILPSLIVVIFVLDKSTT